MGTRKKSLTIFDAKKKYQMELMKIDGVVGVGIGEKKGKECITLYVSSQSEELKKQIPKTLEGFPVVTQYTGEFSAY